MGVQEFPTPKKKMAPTYIYVWDRAPGPLGLGSPHCGTVHDPDPIGPIALIRTHFKAQSEPKNHNESIMSWTCQKQAPANQL